MKRAFLSTAVAALALTAVPVSAAPSTYLGQSTATAAQLTITPPDEDTPQGLVIGYTLAKVNSEGAEGGCEEDNAIACATAAGELMFGSSAHAYFPGQPSPDPATAFTLPAELEPLLNASIGKATAAADGTPAGEADASAAELEINATRSILENLPTELKDGIDAVIDGLADGAEGTPFQPLTDALTLIRENAEQAPLLQVFVGPTSSDAAGAGNVTATATANGATVVVLPFLGSDVEDPQGFAIVEVGKASASVTSDGTKATADFTPAIATIKIFDPSTGTYQSQALEGGTRCLFAGTPLQPLADEGLDVCVTAGGGTTTEDGSTATAEAAAVSVEAFSGPFPTVSLALAKAEASVGAELAPAPTPTPTVTPPAPPSMPKTGGGLALPALGLIGLGGALYRARKR